MVGFCHVSPIGSHVSPQICHLGFRGRVLFLDSKFRSRMTIRSTQNHYTGAYKLLKLCFVTKTSEFQLGDRVFAYREPIIFQLHYKTSTGSLKVAMGGPVKNPQETELDEHQQLFLFLNGLLQQVEASSGVEEPELKAKIAALQAETRKTPAASSSQMSEVEVARELDQMSAKLESLGALVDEAAADPEVQNLLANSATLWVPVITASVEDRSSKVSSQDSPDHKQQ